DVALVQPALVPAELCGVPELDPARPHAEAGPARRPRNLASIEPRFDLGDALLEGRARIQRFRLQRRPCTDLAAARAAGEIGVGLVVRHGVHAALDPYLHAFAHP